MSNAYNADGREPSEDYIKAMMYVIEEHTTDLSGQEIYDITHTLIMSGFYTGIERHQLEGHLVPEGSVEKLRGTVNSYPPREPVLKTENQYELELTKELGGAIDGPFSEALENAKKEASEVEPDLAAGRASYGTSECTCDQCTPYNWD
ncbi:hypothetical protein CNR33_00084 [Pseudomonas phage tabernarius]|uniref:Uncharacterized protein n=1 Tax=Pseudomonas phage tabernarius TaxID=2048978 RepID=A0A2H4P7B8_9CAUD|nr:hypothetical protein FDJ17_gp84 [Pseudomonas phage tabernarius]ATW57930.1 hypothetical protein CNR33_00084 [Pseudomonas phage tabernarius]